jgi:hypothetical protein
MMHCCEILPQGLLKSAGLTLGYLRDLRLYPGVLTKNRLKIGKCATLGCLAEISQVYLG